MVVAFLLAAFCSWCLLRVLISHLRRHLLDQPNGRSSHSQPTPRGGGVAFVLVSAIGSGLLCLLGIAGWPSLLIAIALPLALVGLLDDRFNLQSGWRYVIQIATASLVLVVSPLFQAPLASASLLLLIPLSVLLLLAMTAMINFTNFMDGLDGLVAGCMLVALSAASIRLHGAAGLWILVGGLLGFLIWNWSPAKVFMGDVGSTFLGAVWAGTVLQSTTWLEALGLLLVSTPLMADSCICVIRRLQSGQMVFQAHRLHLFQRLHQAGWLHARVASMYLAATVVLALCFLFFAWPLVFFAALVVVVSGMWLDQNVAVPFSLASQRQ